MEQYLTMLRDVLEKTDCVLDDGEEDEECETDFAVRSATSFARRDNGSEEDEELGVAVRKLVSFVRANGGSEVPERGSDINARVSSDANTSRR